MKRLLFAVFSAVFFLACADTCILAQGTYTATSCNQSSVSAVINGPTHTAVDGDTINIPAGTCTWTAGITVPSDIGITIAGSGTPNSGSSTTGASSSCSSGTTITITSGATAFKFAPEYGNSTSRLSCMTISSGSGSGIALSILGTCTSSGCPNLRMDNITFTNWGGHANVGISYGITAVGDMFGVIDHNTVTGTSGDYLQLTEQSNASYLGVGSYGDNSWAQAESYGTANFLFFENNSVTYAGLTENEGSAGTLANQGGGRVVARYNTFSTDSLNVELAWHGTESSGRPRSSRAWEFYENTTTCPASTQCQPVISIRGGTGLSWGNTVVFDSGAGMSSFLGLNTYRTQGNPSSTWGPCDGSSVFDTNDGTTYYSGTISSVSNNVITVSGSPGWTTSEWVDNGAPYSVHDVTQGSGSEITANTSNTLTYADSGGPGQYSASSGDSIEILRATVCIDQAGGRGAGHLYSGTTPQSEPADEALSPAYLWLNGITGGSLEGSVVAPDTARVISNRDYYTESMNQGAQTSPTSPFNGSSGNGHGTYANIPTTCTVQVGYWATDQNTLYQCTSTNTWTAYYTPYTYPHPLTTGTAPPAAPTGLQATVQ